MSRTKENGSECGETLMHNLWIVKQSSMHKLWSVGERVNRDEAHPATYWLDSHMHGTPQKLANAVPLNQNLFGFIHFAFVRISAWPKQHFDAKLHTPNKIVCKFISQKVKTHIKSLKKRAPYAICWLSEYLDDSSHIKYIGKKSMCECAASV